MAKSIWVVTAALGLLLTGCGSSAASNNATSNSTPASTQQNATNSTSSSGSSDNTDTNASGSSNANVTVTDDQISEMKKYIDATIKQVGETGKFSVRDTKIENGVLHFTMDSTSDDNYVLGEAAGAPVGVVAAYLKSQKSLEGLQGVQVDVYYQGTDKLRLTTKGSDIQSYMDGKIKIDDLMTSSDMKFNP